MPKHIYLRVERNDIDEGSLSTATADDRAQTCPIARSLKRRFPGGDVSVTHEVAFVGWHTYELSSLARDFVRRSDDGGAVEPATFELTLRDRLTLRDG